MDPWTLGPLDYFLDHFLDQFFSTIDSWGGVGRSFSSFVLGEVGIVTLVTVHLHFKANAID